ncbi:TetR/AcrR family transcriptional regulator [Isobaculum melis]|uniref:DNA-binding transcriptional regulator, AcrR family n=1 Tax=Isobaculum melis TaxID=142588 RepID=A0A1H9TAG1_9LACT|nr:TetR/AcrR family transcriptional regulator [Isobaculum melis]SER93623.1 DNA-binding transcriptional regulator, AcrR family [Isobaculum melis]
MAKGTKGFSDEERKELRKKLCLECQSHWALYGYKKTNVRELTAKIGISIGTFYLLYSSKEELFCETLALVQSSLIASIREIIAEEKGKIGFIKAMKWHFSEYEKFPFLYDLGSADFQAFVNRLSKEWIEKLKFNGVAFFYETVALAELSFKVEKEQAYAVVSTLLYTVTASEQPNNSKLDIFSFLLNSVVDQLFTESIK